MKVIAAPEERMHTGGTLSEVDKLYLSTTSLSHNIYSSVHCPKRKQKLAFISP